MKYFAALLLSMSMCLMTSCSFFQANSTGKGTVYQYGKMEGYLQAPLKKIHDATAKAVKDLELMTVEVKKDALFSTYEVKNAKDDTISIDIEKIGNESVKVYVKVGLIGDKVYSQAIFDQIKENL